MACRPQLLIADEPTTALDVTIQAEILGLIKRLKREFGMAVLFITHDMAVVAQLADRVVVMRHGEKVEEGPVERIFADPQAEYTKALLASVPKLGEMRGKPAPEPLRIPGAPEPAAPKTASRSETGRAVPLGQGPDDALPREGRPAAPGRRKRARGRERQLRARPWRDARPRGRVRLRQVHDSALHPAAGRAHVGRRRHGRAGHPQPRRGRPQTRAAQHADGLPGPLRVAQPLHAPQKTGGRADPETSTWRGDPSSTTASRSSSTA